MSEEVFAKTVCGETNGEEEKGQVGVAWVIKNRAHMDRAQWDNITIKGACLQPRQFECWNDKNDIEIKDREVYNKILQLTTAIYKAQMIRQEERMTTTSLTRKDTQSGPIMYRFATQSWQASILQRNCNRSCCLLFVSSMQILHSIADFAGNSDRLKFRLVCLARFTYIVDYACVCSCVGMTRPNF